MKKVLLTACVVVCAAVAASAQGVGTVKLMNWEAQQYQDSKTSAASEKKVARANGGFAAALARAGAKAALNHKAAQEAAAANDTTTAQPAVPVSTETAAAPATPVAPAKPAAKKVAKKKTFWDYVIESIPTDGHCTTQPFK